MPRPTPRRTPGDGCSSGPFTDDITFARLPRISSSASFERGPRGSSSPSVRCEFSRPLGRCHLSLELAGCSNPVHARNPGASRSRGTGHRGDGIRTQRSGTHVTDFEVLTWRLARYLEMDPNDPQTRQAAAGFFRRRDAVLARFPSLALLYQIAERVRAKFGRLGCVRGHALGSVLGRKIWRGH
jgi:hypothetical protein